MQEPDQASGGQMKILRLPKAVWPTVFAAAAPMFAMLADS